jgi:hypothetical protein
MKKAKICVDNDCWVISECSSSPREFGVKFPQAQLYATFRNKLLRMVNAFRRTDGKLAYLFRSIGWFVPSNLGSKKFLSVQMQCAHTDSMCCAYKVLVSIHHWQLVSSSEMKNYLPLSQVCFALLSRLLYF